MEKQNKNDSDNTQGRVQRKSIFIFSSILHLLMLQIFSILDNLFSINLITVVLIEHLWSDSNTIEILDKDNMIRLALSNTVMCL